MPAGNPATRSAGAEVATALAAPILDWNGEPVTGPDGDYDDYLERMPSKEDLRPFPEPVRYWEPLHPGCALQPYPRMGRFASTDTGLWTAYNAAQEAAIREHLTMYPPPGVENPDTLRITDEQWATMSGGAGEIRYCQDCHFVCCAMPAITLHERLTGHRTDSQPRKDR